jgi:hypothetical protein
MVNTFGLSFYLYHITVLLIPRPPGGMRIRTRFGKQTITPSLGVKFMYSTLAKEQPLIRLNPYFVSGFIDGEGSFPPRRG